MPFLAPIIPVLTALAPVATAGVTIGETLANSGGSGGGDASKILAQQQQQQAAADAAAKQKAILASLPDSQSQTGGNVNDPTLVNIASIIAGIPGAAGTPPADSALKAFLGTPNSAPSSQDNLVSSTFGLSGGQG